MDNRLRFSQLTAREIEQLLADSPLPSRNANDAAPVSSRVILKEEDLNLLDETDLCGHLSSSPIESSHQDDSVYVDAPTYDFPTGKNYTLTEKISSDQLTPSPTLPDFPPESASPPSVHQGSDDATSVDQRTSLSRLIRGWNTLMGHPTTGSICPGLSAPSQSIPVFSPLLTQSSKLFTDVVSSLLSPWSRTPGAVSEQFESGSDVQAKPTQSGSCEDSLVTAFEKIVIKDTNSENDDVFFSPTHERVETTHALSKPQMPVVRLRSVTMENTQCDFNTESSLYSDAKSAQSSLMSSAQNLTNPSILSHPALFSPPLLGATNTVYSREKGDPSSLELSHHSQRPVNADMIPALNITKSVAIRANDEDEGAQTTDGGSLLSSSFPRRSGSLNQDLMTHNLETSKSMFTSEAPPKEAFGPTSNETSPNLSPIYLDSEQAFDNLEQVLGPQFSRQTVAKHPRTEMCSDDGWDNSRKSADLPSETGNQQMQFKPTACRRKSNLEVNTIRDEAENSIKVAPRRRGATIPEEKSLQLRGSYPSPPKSIHLKAAVSTVNRITHLIVYSSRSKDSDFSTPVNPFAEPGTSHRDGLQHPKLEISDCIKPTESSQEDKENVSPETRVFKSIPGASPTAARRRSTHRLLVPSVGTEPIPTPRHFLTRLTNQGKILGDQETTEEEKARLRREIKDLRDEEDVLRVVLNKYESAFEEALDQRSHMHFAAVSARSQADGEACEARRQAATLYNAVLDSRRRHERMRESIEKCRIYQEECLKRVETLKVKYLRQSEKGVSYQKYCVGKIQKALESLEVDKNLMEKELSKLRVQCKQMEMKQGSLEAELKRKAQENQELTRICDSLLT